MIFKLGTNVRAAAGAIVMLGVTWAWCAEPADRGASKPGGESPAVSTAPADGVERVTVATARDRAKLMHKVYSSTLDTMHRHYFHTNRSVLPARAMEDVFEEIAEEAQVEARWIAVNTPAMSIHHEPRSDFEKRAAAAIAAGKGEFELVEKGLYRRAGAIALADGCVACHTGFAAKPPSSQRFVGLVISMPVVEK